MKYKRSLGILIFTFLFPLLFILSIPMARGQVIKGMIVVDSEGVINAPNWAKEGIKSGYGFLVLAIPSNGLSKGRWEEFCRICDGLSSPHFKLIPAMETRYKWQGRDDGYRIISFGMKEWVEIHPEEWTKTHFPLWFEAKASQVLSSPWETNSSIVRQCNLIQAAEAITLMPTGVRRNTLWEDYVNRGYRIAPVAVMRNLPPSSLAHIPYVLYAFANSSEKILDALNFWDGFSSFISSGPIIEEFAVGWHKSLKPPHFARPGGWFCAPYGDLLVFKVRASSNAPILKVSVYGNRGEELISLSPKKREIDLNLSWRFVESSIFYLKIWDAKGKEAVSSVITSWGYPGLTTQDCLDRNNIFCYWTNKIGESFRLLDIWDIPGNWWHTLSSTATVTSDPFEYLPQVLRGLGPGNGFGCIIHSKVGDIIAEKTLAGRIYSSPLVTIGYGEGEGKGIRVKSYWFLPEPFSACGRPDLKAGTVLYMEKEITLDNTLETAELAHEPPIIAHSFYTSENMRDQEYPFSRLGIISEGVWRYLDTPLNSKEGWLAEKVKVKRGEFVCLYGNEESAVAFFPLEDSLVSLSSGFSTPKGGGLITLLSGPIAEKINKGKPLKTRAIILISPPIESLFWSFAEEFRREFVLYGGAYQIQLAKGKILEKGFPAVIEADGRGRVEGYFSFKGKMLCPLLVEIRGVPSGQVLFIKGRERFYLPVWEGKTYILLDNCQSERVFFQVLPLKRR